LAPWIFSAGPFWSESAGRPGKARNTLLELEKFRLDFDLVWSNAGFVQLLRHKETLPRKKDRPRN
jgi:hypothetical protein